MPYLDKQGLGTLWNQMKDSFATRALVTTVTNGLMSASDKVKLDGLQPAYDYVVESGTTSRWRYRRWASGLYECWFLHNYGQVYLQSGTTGVGYSYESGLQEAIPFPVTFSEVPQVFLSLTYVSGENGHQPFFAGVNTQTATGTWRASNPRASMEGYYYVELYVYGNIAVIA